MKSKKVSKIRTKVPMSAAVPPELLEAINKEAKRLERSRSYVVEKIIMGELALPEPSVARAETVESEVSG